MDVIGKIAETIEDPDTPLPDADEFEHEVDALRYFTYECWGAIRETVEMVLKAHNTTASGILERIEDAEEEHDVEILDRCLEQILGNL